MSACLTQGEDLDKVLDQAEDWLTAKEKCLVFHALLALYLLHLFNPGISFLLIISFLTDFFPDPGDRCVLFFLFFLFFFIFSLDPQSMGKLVGVFDTIIENAPLAANNGIIRLSLIKAEPRRHFIPDAWRQERLILKEL